MVVATAQILPERIPDTPYAGPSWTNDSAGFFYNQITGPRETAERYKNSRLMYHRVATGPASDRLIAQNGHSSLPIGEHEFPGIQTTPGSDIAMALLFKGVQREITAYAAPTVDVLDGTAKWRRCATAATT